MLKYVSEIQTNFIQLIFFDQFLMINLIFYYRGHLVLTALFPIPTSVIPRLSFFWTLSFMLSVKKKNSKQQHKVRESQGILCCQLNHSTEQIKNKSHCQNHAVLCCILLINCMAICAIISRNNSYSIYMDFIIIMFIKALVSTNKNVLMNRESKEKNKMILGHALHGCIFLQFKNKHTWRKDNI